MEHNKKYLRRLLIEEEITLNQIKEIEKTLKSYEKGNTIKSLFHQVFMTDDTKSHFNIGSIGFLDGQINDFYIQFLQKVYERLLQTCTERKIKIMTIKTALKEN